MKGGKEGRGGRGKGPEKGKEEEGTVFILFILFILLTLFKLFFLFKLFILLNIPTEGWEGETKNIYFGGKVYINQHIWADRDKCYIYIINKAW